MQVEEGVPSQLWVNGQSEPVTMIWVSATHAELIVADNIDLRVGQLSALVVRGFISMPMRVELQNERHILLRFVQRPHSTVLQAIQNEMLATGIEAALESAEDAAKVPHHCFDLEVWGREEAEAA